MSTLRHAETDDFADFRKTSWVGKTDRLRSCRDKAPYKRKRNAINRSEKATLAFMPSGSRQWTPGEWETFVHTLLSLRYGHTEYQRVPATHGGDCGIEGFSMDGAAYQCYAAQGYTSVKNLFEKQRDKMTEDVRKFVDNRSRLLALFGPLMMRRWMLVVPEHTSEQLVAHAARKTEEVLLAAPPYITADFRVGVITDEYFQAERLALVSNGAFVAVDPISVGGAELSAFQEAVTSSSLLTTLDNKLSRVPAYAEPSRKKALILHLTHGYLRGQAVLTQLHDNYPEIHRKVVMFKQRKEDALALLSAASVVRSEERLERHLNELATQIIEEVPSVTPMVHDLVAECVADWLMRCPLEFFPVT